ncbi:hypothetical protein IEE91_06660 [Kocuria sp. cx-455]|uniref:hypothetical protein n=2 Tax=unclassified Candidatus Sulfotelmatobacter TaxID=2635724 RepID=UPI0016823260|nr:hypothetical protein [Kocuria sp. cx-455]MBD2764874.1 hypothetical protein [Kocuria sp. cx-455]
MKTLRNAAILTALGATAIVIMPMDSQEATTVPGIVVTPQATTGASPSEATTPSSADRAEQAPDPAAPAPIDPPAAPAPALAPVPVPQAPALGGVCEWDDDEWEYDDGGGDDRVPRGVRMARCTPCTYRP